MPYKTEDDIRKHFLPVSFPSSLSFLPLFFLPLQHSLQWHPPIPAPRSRNPRLSNNNLLPMSICPMECPLPLRNCMIRTSSTCLLWNLAMFSSSCSTYCWDFFFISFDIYTTYTSPIFYFLCSPLDFKILPPLSTIPFSAMHNVFLVFPSNQKFLNLPLFNYNELAVPAPCLLAILSFLSDCPFPAIDLFTKSILLFLLL